MPKALIIATNGFEQDELFRPREALLDEGVEVTLASLSRDPIQGEKHGEKGASITPDALVMDVRAEDYDVLIIPGGVGNPDTMRDDDDAVRFVREFMESGKPMAVICHGPWMLVEADVARGRKLTSFSSIQTDMKNAGADWVDEEVVVDGNLVTSRKPDDIPAFNEKLLEVFERAPVGAGR